MFFGHRFWVALGWVWGWFRNPQNLNFQSFFEAKSTTKMIDVLEDSKKPSRTRKKQSQGALTPRARDPGDKIFGQVACWGSRGGYNQLTKKQMLVILTRPWAKGPANIKYTKQKQQQKQQKQQRQQHKNLLWQFIQLSIHRLVHAQGPSIHPTPIGSPRPAVRKFFIV